MWAAVPQTHLYFRLWKAETCLSALGSFHIHTLVSFMFCNFFFPLDSFQKKSDQLMKVELKRGLTDFNFLEWGRSLTQHRGQHLLHNRMQRTQQWPVKFMKHTVLVGRDKRKGILCQHSKVLCKSIKKLPDSACYTKWCYTPLLCR